MKNIIITGSTGMIGRIILEECLKRKDVKKITSIARQPSGIKDARLVEVIQDNFLDYSKTEEFFKDQDVCFYCIGVYTGTVPTEEFKKITVDYTKAFADILRKNSKNTTFCFLSGAGADSSEKSRVIFAREKGIAENYLLKLQFNKTYIFRPGYIYPVIPRKEPNWIYKLMRILYKPVSKIYPDFGVTSKKLADKIVDVGLNGGDRTIYDNEHIRKLES
jgi:nucleoside-diphosphate-sugar epimerase